MVLCFFSDSAAYPDTESDVHSWESFLCKVGKEIEKAKVSYKIFSFKT